MAANKLTQWLLVWIASGSLIWILSYLFFAELNIPFSLVPHEYWLSCTVVSLSQGFILKGRGIPVLNWSLGTFSGYGLVLLLISLGSNYSLFGGGIACLCQLTFIRKNLAQWQAWLIASLAVSILNQFIYVPASGIRVLTNGEIDIYLAAILGLIFCTGTGLGMYYSKPKSSIL